MDLRKHMMTTNQLIDCFLYIISYGAPSIPFLLSIGKEFLSREFSASNFLHTNRFLKVLVLLKTYFKDPLFISDEEWKQNVMELFETYREVYLSKIPPLMEAQVKEYKKPSFNPRLYLDNLGFVCFLNGVFQVPDNLLHLIATSGLVAQYHSLLYSYFVKQFDRSSHQLLLDSSLESPQHSG